MERGIRAQARQKLVRAAVAKKNDRSSESLALLGTERDAQPVRADAVRNQAFVGGENRPAGRGRPGENAAGAVMPLVRERDGVAGAKKKRFLGGLDEARIDERAAGLDQGGQNAIAFGGRKSAGANDCASSIGGQLVKSCEQRGQAFASTCRAVVQHQEFFGRQTELRASLAWRSGEIAIPRIRQRGKPCGVESRVDGRGQGLVEDKQATEPTAFLEPKEPASFHASAERRRQARIDRARSNENPRDASAQFARRRQAECGAAEERGGYLVEAVEENDVGSGAALGAGDGIELAAMKETSRAVPKRNPAATEEQLPECRAKFFGGFGVSLRRERDRVSEREQVFQDVAKKREMVPLFGWFEDQDVHGDAEVARSG